MSIFLQNHLENDIDDFMSSLDYTYLQKIYGQMDIKPSNRGFIECGYLPGSTRLQIFFTLYTDAPQGFRRILGLNPVGSRIESSRGANPYLSEFGVAMFYQMDKQLTGSIRSGRESPDNNGSYTTLELDASPYIWDGVYKPPLQIVEMEKSHIHIYNENSRIELHQDTPQYGIVTAVRWLHSQAADRRFIHGKRSAKDLERFMMGAIEGVGHMHEISRPREIEWKCEVKVSAGRTVLINNANPVFFHGTHSIQGTSASLISHYSVKIN